MLDCSNPIPVDDMVNEINGKLDNSGGAVTGNLYINGTLAVDNNVVLHSYLSVENYLQLGISPGTGNSRIQFLDSDGPIPTLHWNNTNKEFQVDTDTQSNLKVWHAGNAPLANIPTDTGTGDLYLSDDGTYKTIPVAQETVMGGFQMRLDPATSTVYLTTDGTQP